MRCPYCGQESAEGTAVCPTCGNPLVAPPATSYSPPPQPYAAPQPTSGMAIASLVTGILGLTFCTGIGSIAALVTGYMAKKEIEGSQGQIAGRGLATAGLILGWIGLGLVVVSLCIGLVFLLIGLIAASTAGSY